jgi:hypothetical protein
MDNLTYKDRIFLLKLSRKVLAARLGLTYASFSSRLNDFTPWQGDEEHVLQDILTKAEAAQQAEKENVRDPVYKG